MPIIPRYQAKEVNRAGSGLVEIDPRQASQPERAMVQQGQEISQIGFAAAKLNSQYMEAERKAQDAHDKAMLRAAMLKSDAELENQFNDDPDYVSYPKKLAKFQEVTQAQMKGLIRNPKLAEELAPEIEAHQLKQSISVKALGRKRQLSEMQNNYASYVVPQFTKAIMEAPDPESRAGLQQQFSVLTDDYIRTGVMTAYQGVAAKTSVTVGVDKVRAEQDAMMRPSEFLKKSDEQRKIDYPFLNSDQLRELDVKAFKEKRLQLAERDQEEKKFQEERSYEALNILSGKGTASQKIAGIKALANPDPKTGFRGIDAWRAVQIIDKLERGEEGGNGGGDNVAYIYAMGAAREGMLSKQDLLKYRPMLSPKQFAMVDVTNNTAVRKEQDADFKALKSQVAYMESTYANDLQGMFPNDKGLRNLLEADFRETASTYLNSENVDKDALGKLNRRRVNMIDWAKTTGVKSAVRQLEKITKTGIYPDVKQATPNNTEQLPEGWTRKNGKVYNKEGKPMKWVD